MFLQFTFRLIFFSVFLFYLGTMQEKSKLEDKLIGMEQSLSGKSEGMVGDGYIFRIYSYR